MLLAGTGAGIYGFSADGPSVVGLEGEGISALAGSRGRLLAAARAKGVVASNDGGKTWSPSLPGVESRSLRVLSDGSAYAGCSPVALYRRPDASGSFSEVTSIRSLPPFPAWNFPTPPHLGNVRSLSSSGEAVYAGIEVGGVIASRDRGETWTELREGLHPDVHEVAWAGAGGREMVYAATGQGFHRSLDGGATWEAACNGLHNLYTVTMAVHPEVPDVVFTTATEGRPRYWRTRESGACAVIYRSRDAAATWQPAMAGMGESLAGAVEALAVDPDDPSAVYAGTADGKVLASHDGGDSWTTLAEGLPPVHALAFDH